MNEYRLSDISLGQSEEFQVTVTKEMFDDFLSITGDVNPMHTDENYAQKNGYGGVILYGMCTASLYSTLVGVYLPGKYCLFHKCDVEWPKPVYLGDVLKIKGTVKEIDEKTKRLLIYGEIRNQDGLKVSRAKLLVGIQGDDDE